MRRHPKITTTAVNVTAAFIAFNQGITKSIGPAMSGNAPEALRQLAYGETGLDVETGNVDFTQTSRSVASKVAAVVWKKGASYILKHFKV